MLYRISCRDHAERESERERERVAGRAHLARGVVGEHAEAERERAAHLTPQATSVKVTGLAQTLGKLEAVDRGFQSKYWANLNCLGQPCKFRATDTGLGPSRSTEPRRRDARSARPLRRRGRRGGAHAVVVLEVCTLVRHHPRHLRPGAVLSLPRSVATAPRAMARCAARTTRCVTTR
jgi:hypothetical protein